MQARMVCLWPQRVHEPPKDFTPAVNLASTEADPMVALTRRVAPCDWRLYEMATESTSRLLREWRALQQEWRALKDTALKDTAVGRR